MNYYTYPTILFSEKTHFDVQLCRLTFKQMEKVSILMIERKCLDLQYLLHQLPLDVDL